MVLKSWFYFLLNEHGSADGDLRVGNEINGQPASAGSALFVTTDGNCGSKPPSISRSFAFLGVLEVLSK